MKFRISRSVFVCLLSISIFTACAGSKLSTAPVLPPIQVSYALWTGYFPLVIAQEKGFFTQQGIQVQTILGTGDTVTNNQLSAVSSGKTAVALLPLGDAINIIARNPDVRIVVAVDQSDGADAVLAEADITTVAELKGKHVGAKLGTFGELFVLEMLKANGMTADDVVLTNVTGEQVPDRLKEGGLQAGHTWEPYVSRSIADGNHVIFNSHQTPGLIPDVLTFSSQTLRDRPQDAKAFIRAWFQAVEYWQAHPQEGSALIEKTLKLDPGTAKLEGIKLMSRADNLQFFQPNQKSPSIYTVAQRYNSFFVQTGGIRQPISVEQVIDPSFLGD
jgi:NitT/TauT family transport system substrate-binding protein